MNHISKTKKSPRMGDIPSKEKLPKSKDLKNIKNNYQKSYKKKKDPKRLPKNKQKIM
jgi:hypothetical protein